MDEFVTGQRWINDAELQLGLGTVLEVEHRNVTILFLATDEKRTYSRQTAPLTRITFSAGDTIRTRDGVEIVVETVTESSGLMTYSGSDKLGHPYDVDEVLLDNQIQLNRPSERLLSCQVDRNKWFELRYQSLVETNRICQSPLHGLNGCRVSLIPHQLFIAHEVANRYAPRVLLADEVGLGKTIEAGLVIHQQLLTERARRVLIVVPESLVHQWFVELLRRFNLHFSIFNEERYQGMLEFDKEHNPFYGNQLVLCSLAFLTENESVLEHAIHAEWDMLVVDEAHHLQWGPEHSSAEYLAIERLASITAGILLLTATPEQLGKTGHFARLRLLDPERFPAFDAFVDEERRYQPVADIIDTLLDNPSVDLSDLKTLAGNIQDTEREIVLSTLDEYAAANKDLTGLKDELLNQLLDRHGTGRVLFRNTRAAVSGFPERKLFACPLSLPPLYRDLSGENPAALLTPERIYSDENPDRLQHWTKFDPRVNWLLEKLLELRPDKVLVIAARTETVLELAESMRIQAGMHVAVFHEGMSIIERDRAAAYFADKEDGCQALLCSEIGSEGRNFQFAHHLVLFDLPDNPDLLEQRIGRLDRIGQTESVHIHVPYLEDSAQETMFRWLHEGLNAFERSCAAASVIFAQLENRLTTALSAGDSNIDALLDTTRANLASLEESLQKGRDRLLEYNSCRPAIAQKLRQQALEEDANSVLAQYMDGIFDCFGVHTEEHSRHRYILSPGENMLTAFPQLQEDGMTITYDRETALAHEDVHYLTWDHPMVTGAMELVLSSELGNTALVAIDYEAMEAGTLLLESIYIYESASSLSLHTRRYLPPTSIRVLISETGERHENVLSHALVNQHTMEVDRETASAIVKAKAGELKQMTKKSEELATIQLAAIQATARQGASRLVQGEIDRLKALHRVNKNIRNIEIEYYEQQRETLDLALQKANLRLDALRVIVCT